MKLCIFNVTCVYPLKIQSGTNSTKGFKAEKHSPKLQIDGYGRRHVETSRAVTGSDVSKAIAQSTSFTRRGFGCGKNSDSY